MIESVSVVSCNACHFSFGILKPVDVLLEYNNLSLSCKDMLDKCCQRYIHVIQFKTHKFQKTVQSSSSKSNTLKVGWDISAWGGGEGVGGATTTAGGRRPCAT